MLAISIVKGHIQVHKPGEIRYVPFTSLRICRERSPYRVCDVNMYIMSRCANVLTINLIERHTQVYKPGGFATFR